MPIASCPIRRKPPTSEQQQRSYDGYIFIDSIIMYRSRVFIYSRDSRHSGRGEATPGRRLMMAASCVLEKNQMGETLRRRAITNSKDRHRSSDRQIVIKTVRYHCLGFVIHVRALEKPPRNSPNNRKSDSMFVDIKRKINPQHI